MLSVALSGSGSCHESYQEACFHSLEHVTLHVHTHNCVLADHGKAIADSHCLLQPVGPAPGCPLQALELSLLHRQHTMQLCLQNPNSVEGSAQKHCNSGLSGTPVSLSEALYSSVGADTCSSFQASAFNCHAAE